MKSGCENCPRIKEAEAMIRSTLSLAGLAGALTSGARVGILGSRYIEDEHLQSSVESSLRSTLEAYRAIGVYTMFYMVDQTMTLTAFKQTQEGCLGSSFVSQPGGPPAPQCNHPMFSAA